MRQWGGAPQINFNENAILATSYLALRNTGVAHHGGLQFSAFTY